MSSEAAARNTSAAGAASTAEADVPSSEGVKAASEANIAATDANRAAAAAADNDTEDKNDAAVDTMAADATAEGAVSGAAVVAPDSGSAAPASKKGKDSRRRSSGVPEHKAKKGGSKRKEVVLNLDCQPGDFYFARMKGHPEWPAVIADEAMLPEPILGSRPVTARRSDYTYRDDYAEGGKNAKDRTYPVMFLGTNEFAWMVNSDLRKLEPEDVEDVSKVKITKKGLLEAYKVAQKQHGLEHFRNLLTDFEASRVEEERLAEEAAAAAEESAARAAERAKAEPKGKKAKRKSVAGADDDEMDVDDEEAEAPKASKKRKKSGVDTDVEDKPVKTAKIKLNSTKVSNGEPAGKSKSKSSKPSKTSKSTAAAEAPAALSESEQRDKKGKNVLYLRHKLQKGFLQEKAPQEADMEAMAAHFETLQQYRVLEPEIIRTTKIHKVLKTILKLDSVPFDAKYNFTKQSKDLLSGWLQILADESGEAGGNGVTNGAAPATTAAKKDEDGAAAAAAEAKAEGGEDKAAAKKDEDDADTSMAEAGADEGEKEAEPSTEEAAPAEKMEE